MPRVALDLRALRTLFRLAQALAHLITSFCSMTHAPLCPTVGKHKSDFSQPLTSKFVSASLSVAIETYGDLPGHDSEYRADRAEYPPNFGEWNGHAIVPLRLRILRTDHHECQWNRCCWQHHRCYNR